MAGRIDSSTTINLFAAVAVVCTVAGCTWAMATRLGTIEQKIEQLAADHYTKTAAAETALRLAIGNPTLRVPDPRSPERYITANSHAGIGTP